MDTPQRGVYTVCWRPKTWAFPFLPERSLPVEAQLAPGMRIFIMEPEPPPDGSLEMFAGDREWLERQPGMIPWEEGCAMLRARLDAWLREYSERVCDQVVTSQHSDHRAYLDRLWRCLGYHWHQAAEQARS